MKLISLQAINFMSYPSLNVDFTNAGKVLITGKNKDASAFSSNGSGKSTLLEAVIFGLFEKTIRGITKNDVISKHSHYMILTLVLEQDGETYTIERYRNHVVYGNSSFIKQGQKDITPKSASDTNAFIERLIGVDYKTALSFLVYSVNSFNWADASDSELKAAFEKLFDLTVYSECLNFTKERVKYLQAEIDKAELEATNIKSKIEFTEKVITDYNNQINQWEADHKKDKQQVENTLKQATKDLQDLTQTVTDINNKLIDDLNEDKGNVNDNYLACKAKYDSLNSTYDTSIKTFTNDINQLNLLITSETGELNIIKSNLSQNNKNQLNYEEQIENLKKTEIKDDKCPVCGNEINQDKKEKHTKDLNKRIAQLQKKITTIFEDNETYLQKESELQAQLEENKQILATKAKELEELINKRTPTTWLDDIYSQLLYLSDRIQSTVSMQQHCQSQLDTLTKKENPLTDTLKEHLNTLEELIFKSGEMEKAIKKQKAELDKYKPWVIAFGNKGIKSVISSKMIPALNKQVNKYLNLLSNGEIEAIFSNTTELKSGETSDRFSLKINSTGSKNYESCSEGEKKRINVAICFAINDVITMSSKCQCNVVFFDEVLDAIDNRGVEAIIAMIQNMKNKDGIFVISHNNELQQYFNQVWIVEKENGKSKLIVQ